MAATVLPGEDRTERYTGELIRYVRSLFPMRFYTGEKWWTVYTAAASLRLADMADSVLAHMAARRDLEAWAALRSMYELAVTVAWVLIDPIARKRLWEGEALVHQLKLHNDLAAFNETLLIPAQVAEAQGAQGMPRLANRADEVDKHWSTRVSGLHAPGHLLSYRGLYNAICRVGSRPTPRSQASWTTEIRRPTASCPAARVREHIALRARQPSAGHDADRGVQQCEVGRRTEGARDQRCGMRCRSGT